MGQIFLNKLVIGRSTVAMSVMGCSSPCDSSAVTKTSIRQPRSLWMLFLFLLTFALLFASQTESRHILAVDLGADWAKAATLGSGSGASLRANVVLNDQANRKSPQCVAFSFVPHEGDDILQGVERTFAEMAWSLEPRFPEQVVCGLSLLAGHTALRDAVDIHNTSVLTGEDNKDLLSAEDVSMLTFTVVPQPFRDTVAVRIVGGKEKKNVLEFTAEELVGMFFAYMKRITERGLDGEPVRHLVATVPTIASLAHRQTIVDAAAIAGLRAVRLVHTTTAAAVQLAYINTEQFFTPSQEGSAKYVMIYDMGSRRTEAAVYEFMPSQRQLGRITLVATVTANTLGGLAFDRCIARYVERVLFPNAKPTALKPVLGVSTPAARKASVSLLRASNNARERLSVNQEAPLVVQGVREGISGDFTATISRATFERECAHLFDEAVRLRDAVIAKAKDKLPALQDLSRFEVIGGATRMPRLLERLSEGYGKVADRTLNSDEAAVMGAAYMGAVRANLHVRGFDVVEPLMYDVYFSIAPQLHSSGGVGTQLRGTRRLLFAKGSTILPAVHSLRFQNRTADFTLTLEDSSGHFARAVLVHGVGESVAAAEKLQRHLAAGGVVKSVEEHVLLEGTEIVVEVTVTDSGIPFVSNAYLHAKYLKETIIEKKEEGKKDTVNDASHESSVVADSSVDGENVTGEENVRDNEMDTSPDQTKEQPEGGKNENKDNSDTQKKDNSDNQKKDNSDNQKKDNSDTQKKDNGDTQKKDNSDTQKKEKGNEALDNTSASTGRLHGGVEGVKRFVRSFPLHLASAPMAVGVNLNKTEAVAMRDRLRAFQKVDDERLLRSALRNDLEALILHYKSLDVWEKKEETKEDSTNWREVVIEVARWLDDASDFVEITALRQQHQRLKELPIGLPVTN